MTRTKRRLTNLERAEIETDLNIAMFLNAQDERSLAKIQQCKRQLAEHKAALLKIKQSEENQHGNPEI